jgi:hypothetical protein
LRPASDGRGAAGAKGKIGGFDRYISNNIALRHDQSPYNHRVINFVIYTGRNLRWLGQKIFF